MSEKYVFEIKSHSQRYHLTPLLPLYGDRFCDSFTQSWRAIYGGGEYAPSTTYSYFKRTVRYFLVLAARAIKEPSGPEARIFSCYSLYRGILPSGSDIEQSLSNAFDDMCDRNSNNFGKMESNSSINSEIDTIKSVLWAFSRVGFCPKFTFSAGLPENKEARTPTLAGLAIKAEMFSVNGLGRLEAAEAFVKHNADMLMELRRCLCMEFQDAYETFCKGRRLSEDPRLPNCTELVNILKEYRAEKGEIRDWLRRRLTVSDEQCDGIVYKLASATRHRGMVVKTRNLPLLINTAGSYLQIQAHIQATSVALNAAFHIVIIDSAFNSQPCKDLRTDALTGKERRGKIELVVAKGTKNRKNGRRGSSKNTVAAGVLDEAGWLPKKVNEQVSAKWVIDRWLEMTGMLRASPFINPSDRDRLWIFQRPLEPTIRSRLQSIDSEWWPQFLKRHSGNPVFGGLPITRMAIRRTALNKHADMDDFGFIMNQVEGNHTNGAMAFFYLDKNGAKAILEEMIRNFQHKWEAIAVSGIDHAAATLGVSEQELYRREVLGLEAGLEFAQINEAGKKSSHTEVAETYERPLLDKTMRILRISEETMENLYLAKLGLERQANRMLATNPGRFLQAWLPWTALVEGYIFKIRESRFASTFDRITKRVDMRLQCGQAALPCLW